MKKITFMYPIHSEGWIFCALAAVITCVLWMIYVPLGLIGVLLTVLMGLFFRNPQRVVPQIPGAIVSPADGIVCPFKEKTSPPSDTGLLGSDWTRVSIFMSMIDVHVNRMPIAGKVICNKHHPGKFFDARLDAASEENEKQILVIEDKKNKFQLPFVQVAGLLARRIRCDTTLESTVKAGQVFGLIRFGSRVDVYFPQNVVPQVVPGQTVIAGETVLGNYLTEQKPVSGQML